ncbi:unnamed protein product [Lampetra fluviatilis]
MGGPNGTPIFRAPTTAAPATEPLGRMTLASRLAFAGGHFFNDVCAATWFTYGLAFLHGVAGIGSPGAGLLVLLGQVADGLATPLVGIAADRAPAIPGMARRKSWHLLGAKYWTGRCPPPPRATLQSPPMVAHVVLEKGGGHTLIGGGCMGGTCLLVGTVLLTLTFPFTFASCLACGLAPQEGTLLGYYAPFIVLSQVAWAAVQVSHLALIPELAHTQSEKVELTAYRITMDLECCRSRRFRVDLPARQLNSGFKQSVCGRPHAHRSLIALQARDLLSLRHLRGTRPVRSG